MSRDRFREFPDGEVIEVDPIDIEGDPNATDIVIDPIDIEGDPLAQGKTPPRTLAQRARAGEAMSKDEAVDYGAQLLGIHGLGAWGRSTADAATFGFADELAAAGQSAIHGDDYATARDSLRSDLETSRENYPIASGIGTATGIAATLPMLSALPAAEGAGARFGLAVGEGAGFGALGAAGDSEADLTAGDTEGFREDIAEGALGGAVTGGVFGGLAHGGRRMVNRLREGADATLESAARQRLRQAGADRVPELRRMETRGTPEEIAGELKRQGVFGRLGLASTDTVQGNVEQMVRRSGEALGEVRGPAAGEPVDLMPALSRIDETMERLGSDPSAYAIQMRSALREPRRLLAQMAEEGPIPFERLRDLMRNAGTSITDAVRASESGRADAMRMLYGLLSDAERSTVGRIAPGAVDVLEGAKRQHELGRGLQDVYERAAQREAGRNTIGLTDLLSFGGGGAALGGLIDAAGGGGAAGLALLLGTRAANSPRVRATIGEIVGGMGRRARPGAGGDALDALRRALEVGGASEPLGEAMLADEPEAAAEPAPVVDEAPVLAPEDEEGLAELFGDDAELTEDDEQGLAELFGDDQ